MTATTSSLRYPAIPAVGEGVVDQSAVASESTRPTQHLVPSQIATTKASARRFGDQASNADSVLTVRQSPILMNVDSLNVRVLRDAGGLDLHADWPQLNWKPHLVIRDGLRKTVAAQLRVSECDIHVGCSLYVHADTDKATARLWIEPPASQAAMFCTTDVQDVVQRYVDSLSGKKTHDSDVACALSVDHGSAEACESASCDERQSDQQALATELSLVAANVRSIVGGCTLKLPCEIASPAWGDKTFEVSGKLAPKPPRLPSVKKEAQTFECRIDGFRRSKRVVYLRELDGKHGFKEAAFNEQDLFGDIVACAAADSTCVATLEEEIVVGATSRWTLVGLARSETQNSTQLI